MTALFKFRCYLNNSSKIHGCSIKYLLFVHLNKLLLLVCPAGLCGGSASGKTTVANKIIEALDVPWVVLLSMDSFYKVLFKTQNTSAYSLV